MALAAEMRVAQADAVAQRLAVDDDRHVAPQRGLVVEHIAAKPLVGAEDAFERLAHGRALRPRPPGSRRGVEDWR